MVDGMSIRDEVFSQFGPKLMEAMFLSWLRELNEIRIAQGMQPLTEQYILGRLHNDLNHVEDYDWMNDEQ